LSQESGEIRWALKGKKLYRHFKKFGVDGNSVNKSVSLMMDNILELNIIKHFYNDQETNLLSGFKIILKVENILHPFEHNVMIRGSS